MSAVSLLVLFVPGLLRHTPIVDQDHSHITSSIRGRLGLTICRFFHRPEESLTHSLLRVSTAKAAKQALPPYHIQHKEMGGS